MFAYVVTIPGHKEPLMVAGTRYRGPANAIPMRPDLTPSEALKVVRYAYPSLERVEGLEAHLDTGWDRSHCDVTRPGEILDRLARG